MANQRNEEEYESLLAHYSHSSSDNHARNAQGRCHCFKAEFHWRKLGFTHSRRDLFCKSQWPWPPIIFVGYRFIVTAYLLAWLVYTAVSFPKTLRFPWSVWLTNWSFLLLNIHMFLACLITVMSVHTAGSCCNRSSYPRDRAESSHQNEAILPESSEGTTPTSSELTLNFDNLNNSLPWYIKLDWFIFAIISNVCFIVSIVYFALLFPNLINIDSTPPLLTDMHLHLLNSIVILLEMALSAIPVRLLHGLYPLIFGLIYVIFSAIYWAMDHENVLYPNVLDWNQPGMTVIVTLGLAIVIVPLLQLFLFGLYNLRLKIYKRIYASES